MRPAAPNVMHQRRVGECPNEDPLWTRKPTVDSTTARQNKDAGLLSVASILFKNRIKLVKIAPQTRGLMNADDVTQPGVHPLHGSRRKLGSMTENEMDDPRVEYATSSSATNAARRKQQGERNEKRKCTAQCKTGDARSGTRGDAPEQSGRVSQQRSIVDFPIGIHRGFQQQLATK